MATINTICHAIKNIIRLTETLRTSLLTLPNSIYITGILDQSSALAGLIMFRNTPRSPTDLSPAQILFGHPIRDNLPHRRNQLLPTQRFEVERRLQDHRQRQHEAQGTQRELPILHPGQHVRV